MADWLGPEGVQAAKVAASGAFGAGVFAQLRHPGSAGKYVFTIGSGAVFAHLFAVAFTVPLPLLETSLSVSDKGSGALWGMLGMTVSRKLLFAVERADFASLFGGGK